MVAGDMEPWKGILTFYLKGFEGVTAQITTGAKLSITYPEAIDYKDVLERLKRLLVKNDDDSPAEILAVIKDPNESKRMDPTISTTQLVKRILDEFRHEYRFLREPLYKEIALRIGNDPDAIRSLLYELAPETGWKEQETEEAKKEAQASINLAGYMKWRQKGDETGQYSPKQIEEVNVKAADEIQCASKAIVRRAEHILSNYPELVPEAKPGYKRSTQRSTGHISRARPTGLDPWPEETNRVWRRVFRDEVPRSGRTGPTVAWAK
jgi:hypothetical protein